MKRINKRKKTIASCYALNAVHCLISYLAIILRISNGDRSILFLGAILTIMIPLSILDIRKEMSGSFAVWTSIILHTILDCVIVILSASCWIGYLSVIETIFLILYWKKRSK